jgi:hypothetical protein
MTDKLIFGHTWEAIQRAQQGGRLHDLVDTSKPSQQIDATLRQQDIELLKLHGEEGLRAMQYGGVLERLKIAGLLPSVVEAETPTLSLECAFSDACLPDYWQGSSLPHISVPVYKGMPLKDLKTELATELCTGCLMGSDSDAEVYNSDAWHSAALEAIEEITYSEPMCFNELDESTLDPESESVYAYFVFRAKGRNRPKSM